jgi:hypothetical protein
MAAASYFDLVMTNRSCTPEILSFYERASTRDMSEFHVSGYCRALHAVHVINYPATGLGGGILEAALYLSSAAWVILLVLAQVAASTRSLYPPGP